MTDDKVVLTESSIFSKEFLKGLDEYVKHDLVFWSRLNLNKDAAEIWQYDHPFDFWYGHTIGMATRSAIHLFMNIYKRKPSQLEDMEIIIKINEYAPQYKNIFDKLKQKKMVGSK